jgi:hypothetical protein
MYDLNIVSFLKYYDDDGKDSKVGEESFEETDKDTEAEIDSESSQRLSSSSLHPQQEKGCMFGIVPKIGKKTQAAVESELGKYRDSLPKYLATEQRKSDYL